MAGSQTILDAPDQRVRGLFLKSRSNSPLSNHEWNRLGARMSAEESTGADGGVVNQPLPREADASAAYDQGRATARGLFAPKTAPAPQALATGLTRTPLVMAPGHGGIDVNSYTGSMYAAPTINSGGVTRVNPMAAQPREGYVRQRSSEQLADDALRARFGSPPNERGQIDVSRVPSNRGLQNQLGDANGNPRPTGSMESPQAGNGIVGTAANPSPNPVTGLRRVQQPPGIRTLSQPATPVASPTTTAQPQTESKNPLTGDGNAQPAGTTSAVTPAAQTLGFTQRGSRTPSGQDAEGTATGGTGLYQRTFKSPQAAGIYDSYVRRLFSPNTGAA